MRVIKQLVGFFIALYIILASQMLLVHSLLANGQTLVIAPVKQVHAATATKTVPTVSISQIMFPIPTATPTLTPTPLPVGDPLSIEIPKLQVNTHVVAVGVSVDNIMETPKDFAEVGWYMKGPRPGEQGAAVVNGHYDNIHGAPAVFYNLSKLSIGDQIIIRTSLGKELKFIVESAYSQPYSSFPKELIYAPYQGEGLRLITCDGIWNPKEKTYSKRLVVNARLEAN